MSHYFSEKHEGLEKDERTLSFLQAGREFVFTTARGVFARNEVDFATRLLIETVEVGRKTESLLDLGTGYGVIGVVLGALHDLEVVMTDVNERALALAEKNLEKNGVRARVLKSDGFAALRDERFDLIVTNPPIRIGKERLFPILDHACDHLSEGGALWLVCHKKHGAKTLKAHLEKTYDVETVKRKKGFHVFVCRPR